MTKALRAAVVAGIGVVVLTGGTAVADPPGPGFRGCRPNTPGEDHYGRTTGNPNDPRSALPTVYTDGFATYLGVCGWGGYAQVDNVAGAVDGYNPLVELRTGVDPVDDALGGTTEVWLPTAP